MFGFITGVVETVAKTAVALPIAVIADVVTGGGTATGKRGNCYTEDAFKSIGESLDKMNED